MLYKAKNARLCLENLEMDYIRFGKGEKILIMLPGLGDGLATVKGMALPMALTYRMYAKKYTVYVLSRKNQLSEGYSTREMAGDCAQAMAALGITKAHVLGISQGGMVAQYLALDYPQLLDRLVLAVSCAEQSQALESTVKGWIELAEMGNYPDLMIDTAEKMYSEAYLKKYRRLYPLLVRMKRPKSFERFIIQAKACLSHNALDELGKISCPCLVVGAAQDKVLGGDSALALAEKISGSQLYIYEALGHGAYEEAPDFNRRVLDFLD